MRRDSLTARLYRWFYCTNQMPMSLCSYFWAVFWMYLVIVPYTICVAPALLLETCYDKWYNRLGPGIFSWFVVIILGSMLYSISVFWIGWRPDNTWQGVMQRTGSLCWIFICTVGIIFAVGLIRDWRHQRYIDKFYKKVVKAEQANLVVAYYRAFREKYCPKLDWDN